MPNSVHAADTTRKTKLQAPSGLAEADRGAGSSKTPLPKSAIQELRVGGPTEAKWIWLILAIYFTRTLAMLFGYLPLEAAAVLVVTAIQRVDSLKATTGHEQ